MVEPAPAPNPDYEVVTAFGDALRFTTAEIAAVQVEIEQRVRDSGVTWHSFGADVEAATTDLGPDGAALAAELHSSYGDRVRITVGGRVYPPDGAVVPTMAAPEATRAIPGLRLRAVPDTSEVVTGQVFRGTVQLTNIGRKPIRFDTDQPVAAVMIDAAGRVAGTFSGLTAGTGFLVDLAPGAAQEIRFFGGTAGGSGEQYSTPPGSDTVTVVVPVRSRPQGDLVTPPVPLRVTHATPRASA